MQEQEGKVFDYITKEKGDGGESGVLRVETACGVVVSLYSFSPLSPVLSPIPSLFSTLLITSFPPIASSHLKFDEWRLLPPLCIPSRKSSGLLLPFYAPSDASFQYIRFRSSLNISTPVLRT